MRATAGRAASHRPRRSGTRRLLLRRLPIGSIVPNARQPRTAFDEEAMAELVESIKEVGCSSRSSCDRWVAIAELVMGSSAGELRNRPTCRVPAIVRETQDHDLLQRRPAGEPASGAAQPVGGSRGLSADVGGLRLHAGELSARIKRSRPQISNTIRLLKLPPTVQRRVAAGVLSAGHARAILMVDDNRGAGGLPSGWSPRASRFAPSRSSRRSGRRR
jgi:ParB family chromosome partitioning protein